MVDNRQQGDNPQQNRPVVPDADNSTARKAAGVVAAQDKGKPPSQLDLAKANVQDKVDQVRHGAALAAGKLKDAGSAVKDAGGNAVKDVGNAAKGAGGVIKDAGSAVKDAGGNAIKGAGGAIRDAGGAVKDRADAALHTAAGAVADKAGAAKRAAAGVAAGAILVGTPMLQAVENKGKLAELYDNQRNGALVEKAAVQAKPVEVAKAAEVAKASEVAKAASHDKTAAAGQQAKLDDAQKKGKAAGDILNAIGEAGEQAAKKRDEELRGL